ncbi:MAG: NAD(P)-dependent oxidoreductase [Ignavibacterium sp.]|nr:NAD(P)-dependent oxidoreductase [Ignavibacterium sp.]
MSLKKILILGSKSFASTGLYNRLNAKGFLVKCFNRGNVTQAGDFVSGNVMDLNNNKHLSANFDAVINFIVLKDQDVQANINYIKAVVEFCKQNRIKRLIQISSLSVYPNDAKFINEMSEIENDIQLKGPYASIKAAVDKYLIEHQDPELSVSFIRPGFITNVETNVNFAGILKRFPPGINLLMGDRNTILPLIDRDNFHNAIERILQSERIEPVYVILSNPGGTKHNFVKHNTEITFFTLPKNITLIIGKILTVLKILSKTQYWQIKGLFKTTFFDCSRTEEILKIKF